jgi:hypothetical protein
VLSSVQWDVVKPNWLQASPPEPHSPVGLCCAIVGQPVEVPVKAKKFVELAQNLFGDDKWPICLAVATGLKATQLAQMGTGKDPVDETLATALLRANKTAQHLLRMTNKMGEVPVQVDLAVEMSDEASPWTEAIFKLLLLDLGYEPSFIVQPDGRFTSGMKLKATRGTAQ